MAVVSFKQNPAAFGMPALAKPDYRRAKNPALKPSGKKIIMPFYDSTLIGGLFEIPGMELNPAPIGDQPEPELIKAPFELIRLDGNYQRELKRANIALIEFAINNFDYTKVKVPNGIRSPKGNIYLTDGQSTAMIYYNHPELRARGNLPCCVTRVDEKQFVERSAAAFISLNECRVSVAQADRFSAALAMRDPAAKKLAQIFQAHNIKIVTDNREDHLYAAGETRLISTFQSLLAKKGDKFLEKLCGILSTAMFSPIKRAHIRAVVEILETHKGELDEARLTNAIKSIADRHALNQALIDSRRTMKTVPYALAQIYKDRYKKGAKAL